MASALTPSQVHVLRRVRDGELWAGEGTHGNELGEAMILAGFGLLDYVERGIFGLTELGQCYLAAIERATLEAGTGEAEQGGPSDALSE